METSHIPDLKYKVLPLSEVRVRGVSEFSNDNKHRLSCGILVEKEWYKTTDRFWNSFFSKFGFSDSIFKYYKHQEVFDRICEKQSSTTLRFCLNPEAKSVLAVSNPNKPVIQPAEITKLIHKYKDSEKITYLEGVVSSVHTPAMLSTKFKIGPDLFYNKYTLDTPLDGYGKPSIYLMLLRQICENGAVALAPAFRSEIKTGDEPIYSLGRALESFDSDEGYSTMKQRFESAQLSPASLAESLTLLKLLKKMEKKDILEAYEKVVGDVYDVYGVANLDGISAKKLRLLPAKCKVYDLLNLASEVATHKVPATIEAKKLQSWIGTTISAEYDLEGTESKKENGFLPKFFERSNPRLQTQNN